MRSLRRGWLLNSSRYLLALFEFTLAILSWERLAYRLRRIITGWLHRIESFQRVRSVHRWSVKTTVWLESLWRDSRIHIACSLLSGRVILVRGRWLRNMIWVATTRHLRWEVMIYIDIVIMILLNIVFLVYIICIHLWSRSLSLW